ncbi:hypothetical protein BASA50_007356 [Batrachochytrium salamandrivorans]|uniref:H/ACA ribonucleoprotein complex non-core subunit NAF1 n=1 Tax=Batrachochytrium salamandrivorans TaxID=1357716 RepID=A0ABQ8F7C5_9FUNG|nr:hypothetical protein BASA50_007356 [Batrachochytrium salamandrivorans]KAH9256770.1 hypothetical protein BASA81_005064 [Batrachochytrium salamandrivorans]KAH9269105.1 hypothetical protein BASA83_008856 [Batrachochytrium salamandrivorans]
MSFFIDTTPTDSALQATYMLHSEEASDYDSTDVLSSDPLPAVLKDKLELPAEQMDVKHALPKQDATDEGEISNSPDSTVRAECIQNDSSIEDRQASDTVMSENNSKNLSSSDEPLETIVSSKDASIAMSCTSDTAALDGDPNEEEIEEGAISEASKMTFSDSDDSSSDSSDDANEPSVNTLTGNKKHATNFHDTCSDEEDNVKTNGVMATKNEAVILPQVEPVDVEIPADLPLKRIGTITAIVDALVVIKATLGGEIQVLDIDSILLFEDRSVLGRIFDTFGPVSEPFYSTRFNSADEVAASSAAVGAPVFFIQDLAKVVLTQPLLKNKGSDASNLYDEEIGEDEVEYSDDDQEAESRRRRKQAKRNQSGNENSRCDAQDENSDYNEGEVMKGQDTPHQSIHRGRGRGGGNGRDRDRGRGGGRGRGRGANSNGGGGYRDVYESTAERGRTGQQHSNGRDRSSGYNRDASAYSETQPPKGNYGSTRPEQNYNDHHQAQHHGVGHNQRFPPHFQQNHHYPPHTLPYQHQQPHDRPPQHMFGQHIQHGQMGNPSLRPMYPHQTSQPQMRVASTTVGSDPYFPSTNQPHQHQHQHMHQPPSHGSEAGFRTDRARQEINANSFSHLQPQQLHQLHQLQDILFQQQQQRYQMLPQTSNQFDQQQHHHSNQHQRDFSMRQEPFHLNVDGIAHPNQFPQHQNQQQQNQIQRNSSNPTSMLSSLQNNAFTQNGSGQ